MLPNEHAVLERLGLSTEDIDVCALYTAGDPDMPPLEYLEGSIDHATQSERETLESLILRRTRQIKGYLASTAL